MARSSPAATRSSTSPKRRRPPKAPPKVADDKPEPTPVIDWHERFRWYPDGCFGPYRSEAEGYSRRELAADFAVHAFGCCAGLVGTVCLLARTYHAEGLPLGVALGIVVYCISLMAMLICSATFNIMVKRWASHLWTLQLADHTGILLLIAGTYTPFMARLCYTRLLAFVWCVGLVSFVAKASKSTVDVIGTHVACFLLMGWSVSPFIPTLVSSFSIHAAAAILGGGCTYTLGLAPWSASRLEFHNAIWHVFVLAGSGVFFAVIYGEVAEPKNWVGSTTCEA